MTLDGMCFSLYVMAIKCYLPYDANYGCKSGKIMMKPMLWPKENEWSFVLCFVHWESKEGIGLHPCGWIALLFKISVT